MRYERFDCTEQLPPAVVWLSEPRYDGSRKAMPRSGRRTRGPWPGPAPDAGTTSAAPTCSTSSLCLWVCFSFTLRRTFRSFHIVQLLRFADLGIKHLHPHEVDGLGMGIEVGIQVDGEVRTEEA